MHAIRQYVLPWSNTPSLDLPAKARVLSAFVESDMVWIAALVNCDEPRVERVYFWIYADNDPVEDFGRFVGTVVLGSRAHHVCERARREPRGAEASGDEEAE